MIIINNLCTGFVCVLSQPSTLHLGSGTRFYFVAILKTTGILTMMALEYVSLNFFVVVFLSCDSFGCFLSRDSFGMFFFLVLCFCAVWGWLGCT